MVLLLIGLVVLGPEKLPDAMRKFGRVYNEVRRVATGIQRDVSSTFAEPVDELRKTASEARRIFNQSPADPPEVNGNEDVAEPRFIPYESSPPHESIQSETDSPKDASAERTKDEDH